MNNLVKITAATGNRHFYLNSPTAKLLLRYLLLVGGVVSGSTERGGAICIGDAGGELNLFYTITSNNRAPAGGGIYAGNKTRVNISNSYVVNNTAANGGGGMYLQSSDANIIHSNFRGNVAGNKGGGIFMVNSVTNIYGSEISSNYGRRYGGGMRIEHRRMVMQDTTISNNKADYEGGGLFVNDCPIYVELKRCIIKNNQVNK